MVRHPAHTPVLQQKQHAPLEETVEGVVVVQGVRRALGLDRFQVSDAVCAVLGERRPLGLLTKSWNRPHQ